MKYELKYDEERDLILGWVEGELDPALVQEMSGEFAKLAEATGCYKLLNDLRKAKLKQSTFHIYNMPRIVAKQGVPSSSRRALVVPDTSEDFSFLETVSVNVGQQVKIFTDMDEALEWLRKD